ncbi:hypothetical protein B0H19DRAFT_1299854 [Mycena capillaripes]|nr:hypothetical protein B0H19DRAFT_1299854 [Mycena capillaripes]
MYMLYEYDALRRAASELPSGFQIHTAVIVHRVVHTFGSSIHTTSPPVFPSRQLRACPTSDYGQREEAAPVPIEITIGAAMGTANAPTGLVRQRSVQLYKRPLPHSCNLLHVRELFLCCTTSFSIRDIEIQNELSPSRRHGFIPLRISIVQAFSPFTSAVAHLLWKPDIEGLLREGIRQIVGPDRSNPIPQIYYSRKFKQLRPGRGRSPSRMGRWELEQFVWTAKHDSYLSEALAYRNLGAFQSSCISSLCGTVRVPMSPSAEVVHPVVDFVPGLALEYIRGPHIGQLKEIASPRSATPTAGTTTFVSLMSSSSEACRTIPSLSSFTSASRPGDSKEQCGGDVDEVMDVRKVLIDPEHGNWHVGSPFPQSIYERIATNHGYALVNSRIEDISKDVRSVQFQSVPGSETPGARERLLLWQGENAG